jgi:putative transposase
VFAYSLEGYALLFLHTISYTTPKKLQGQCLGELKKVYQAQSQRESITLFRVWASRWREAAAKAVACVEQDLEELLAFMGCPKDHWRKLRTTNAIERAFREVRRRTRPMSCFQNSASVDRIIYGIITHLNANWKKMPLPEFTHNS